MHIDDPIYMYSQSVLGLIIEEQHTESWHHAGVPDDVQMRLGSVATSESPLQSQRRPVFITSFDLLSSPPPSLLPFYHE